MKKLSETRATATRAGTTKQAGKTAVNEQIHVRFRPAQVAGIIDGHQFEATLLPMGDGTHMVPIRAALRSEVGKDNGDRVVVHLSERRSR